VFKGEQFCDMGCEAGFITNTFSLESGAEAFERVLGVMKGGEDLKDFEKLG